MEDREIYDVDRAVAGNVPVVKLRGEEFVLADLTAQEQIKFQRKIQLKQNAIMRKQDRIQERMDDAEDNDEELDMEKIESMQDEIAEQMAGLIATAAKLRLAKPKTDGQGNWQYDEMGRVDTEPFPDELAQNLTMREFRAIQAVSERVEGESFDIEPSTGKEQT